MNYFTEFMLHKLFTISRPIQIGKDVSISEWKHTIHLDFWNPRVSVDRYIVDNKFVNSFTLKPIYNYITIHHTQYCDGVAREWQIWFHQQTWLSDTYTTIYGDYNRVSFSSLREAKQRVDCFLIKMQKLKAFI